MGLEPSSESSPRPARRAVGGLCGLVAAAFLSVVSCTSLPIQESSRSLSAVDAQAIVARTVRYKRDQELYGIEHYVASPTQTARRGEGDCEDFSLYFLSLLDPERLGEDERPQLLYLSSGLVPVVEFRVLVHPREFRNVDGTVLVVPVVSYYPVVTPSVSAHAIGIYCVNGLYGTGGQQEDFTLPQFRTLEAAARYHAARTGLDARWGVYTLDRDDWRTYRGDLERFTRWIVPKRSFSAPVVQNINNHDEPIVGDG